MKTIFLAALVALISSLGPVRPAVAESMPSFNNTTEDKANAETVKSPPVTKYTKVWIDSYHNYNKVVYSAYAKALKDETGEEVTVEVWHGTATGYDDHLRLATSKRSATRLPSSLPTGTKTPNRPNARQSSLREMSTSSGTGAAYLRSNSGAQSIHSRPLTKNVLHSGSELTSFSSLTKKTSMSESVTSAKVVLLKNRTRYLLGCEELGASLQRFARRSPDVFIVWEPATKASNAQGGQLPDRYSVAGRFALL
jgi:hypothetical protein